MMREDVSELISAYLDDEVTVAERSDVERLLVENAEAKKLYDDLLALRRRLASLPRSPLRADFSARVLQRLPARLDGVTPRSVADRVAHQDGRDAQHVPGRGRGRRRFGVMVGGGVASLLLVALVVELGWRRAPINLVNLGPSGANGPGGTPGLTVAKDGDKEEATALEQFAKEKLGFVADFTITARGQANRVLENSLGKYGIRFDGQLKVDDRLESKLMASRWLGDVKPADKLVDKEGAPAEPTDDIEMYYLETTQGQFDALVFELQARGDEVLRMRYDILMGSQNMGVIRDLHQSSQSFMAQSGSSSESGAAPVAFRLAWRFSLHSSPERVLGAVSTPLFQPQLLPKAPARGEVPALPAFPSPKAERAVLPADAKADARVQGAPLKPGDKPAYILMIVRKLRAE